MKAIYTSGVPTPVPVPFNSEYLYRDLPTISEQRLLYLRRPRSDLSGQNCRSQRQNPRRRRTQSWCSHNCASSRSWEKSFWSQKVSTHVRWWHMGRSGFPLTKVNSTLHGIPILVKDSISAHGMNNTAGYYCLVGAKTKVRPPWLRDFEMLAL